MATKSKTKITKTTKATKTTKRKNVVAISDRGKVFISSTFNNTVITIANDKGDTVSWGSSGAAGFKGARKSTPFAAGAAAENAAKKALSLGMKSVEVYVKGPGSGRESALRALRTAGFSITMIADMTPIPHNGPRAKKKRRI